MFSLASMVKYILVKYRETPVRFMQPFKRQLKISKERLQGINQNKIKTNSSVAVIWNINKTWCTMWNVISSPCCFLDLKLSFHFNALLWIVITAHRRRKCMFAGIGLRGNAHLCTRLMLLCNRGFNKTFALLGRFDCY